MPPISRLEAVFFRTTGGNEPVRDWLKRLSKDERKAVGEDIAYVQFKWPIGKPRVDHLRSAVWEVRTNLGTRIARTLFAVDGAQMMLLHGFTEPEMAKKMGTSRSQLDRILDPENVSVQLGTLIKSSACRREGAGDPDPATAQKGCVLALLLPRNHLR